MAKIETVLRFDGMRRDIERDLLRKDGEFCKECKGKCRMGDGCVCLEYLVEVLANRHHFDYETILSLIGQWIDNEGRNGNE